MCVAAIGEGANVGVDIQRERPYSFEKMLELEHTFMNDEEFRAFSDTSAVGKTLSMSPYDRGMDAFARKNKEFYTAWTRRESYTKRIGSDIFDNLKTAKIDGESYRDGVITACGERYYYSICAPREAFEEEAPPVEENV